MDTNEMMGNAIIAICDCSLLIAKQIEALNLTLCETNKVLNRIESLQDERNGALMQIVEAVRHIDSVELIESIDRLTTAVNQIDLTT